MQWLLVVAALLAGCPAPRQYAVQRTDVECERAARVVRRTMLTLGYTVTRMTEPTYASTGLVAGTKALPDGSTHSGAVRIRCTATGVEVQPVEEGLVPASYEFSRAFRYSYISLAQRPDVETPRVAEGVQLLVEAIDRFAQRLDLGSEATREGAVLVRVTIRNGTDRAVALAPDGVVLGGTGGTSRTPIAESGLGAVLQPGPGAERVRAELLRRLEVPPRQTAVRFAVYAAGSYGEARVGVQDVETGETEGFFVAVQ